MMPVAMHRLLAISFVSLLVFQPSYASVLLVGRETGGLGFANIYDPTGPGSPEPRAGYESSVGQRPPPALGIGKRECLPNGSNYCFGNNVNFCADCGTCCVKALYCCEKGATCCGTGCCASGHTCSKDGKCLAPVVLNRKAITAISTIFETTTYTTRKQPTVLVVEVETSTILSTVETTISNAATQTDVHWVTATVTALPSSQAAAVTRADGEKETTLSDTKRSLLDSLVLRGVGILHDGAVLHQRQADGVSVASPTTTAAASTATASTGRVPTVATPTAAASSAAVPTSTEPTVTEPTKVSPLAAEPTITRFTTQITTVTELDVKAVTITRTSYVMTTVYETVTKVLNALTTVTVTSTLTVISHPPITQVITTTVDPVIPATASADSEGPSESLSTPAIVGIAVGSAAVFILLVVAIFLFRRRRMRQKAIDASPPSTPEDMLFYQPTLPKLPKLYRHSRFNPGAPAEHHAATAHLPPGYLSPSPSQAFAFGHERSGSGPSTLMGKSGDRWSGFSTTSDGTFEKLPPVRNLSPFEMPEAHGRNCAAEADGKPVTVVATTEPVPRQPSPIRSFAPPRPDGTAAAFASCQSPSQILEQAVTAHARMPFVAPGQTGGYGQQRPQMRGYRGRDFAMHHPRPLPQCPPRLRQRDEGRYEEGGGYNDSGSQRLHEQNRGQQHPGQEQSQQEHQSHGQDQGQQQQEQQPQERPQERQDEARDLSHGQSGSSQQQEHQANQQEQQRQGQDQQRQSQDQDQAQSREQEQPQQQTRQRDERRYAGHWYIDAGQLEQHEQNQCQGPSQQNQANGQGQKKQQKEEGQSGLQDSSGSSDVPYV